jgi:hypothetical protein
MLSFIMGQMLSFFKVEGDIIFDGMHVFIIFDGKYVIISDGGHDVINSDRADVIIFYDKRSNHFLKA